MNNNWSMKEFSATWIHNKQKEHELVVPDYQRMIVWNSNQKATLIDSIKKGLPFGSILLYFNDKKNNYRIIDGLQRANTIYEFIENPASFFNEDDIDDEAIEKIFKIINVTAEKEVVKQKIINLIIKWIRDDYKTMDKLEDIQYRDCTEILANEFATIRENNKEIEITDLLKPMLQSYKKICTKMANTPIPAIVITGNDDNLALIFERINSSGKKLTKEQIYAATWSTDKIHISEDFSQIVQYNRERYENLYKTNDIEIDDFDPIEFAKESNLTIFQLVLGFGKLISNKYPYLFSNTKNINEVESVGFNLINSCLGFKTSEIKNLNKNLFEIVGDDNNINEFLKKIIECINFVDKTLAITTRFKSNVRNNASPIHTEYQICSMIASIFINKYLEIEIDENDKIIKRTLHLDSTNTDWANYKQKFKRNAIKISLIDIIQTNWRGSGDKKLNHVILNKDYYTRDIEKQDMSHILKMWHDEVKSERREYTRIKNPNEAERTVLNIIYSNILTAGEQIDGNNLDIEHIATKERMKKLIKNLYNKGIEVKLPISSIGNLCFLPEEINRAKHDKTIYQINLNDNEIKNYEEKYTFTTHDDLKWIEDDDINKEDLIYKYTKFINTRFDKLCDKLLEVLYPDNKT